jgi:hypothetical protein
MPLEENTSTLAVPASFEPCPEYDLKKIAHIVYKAMGPGTPTLTYRLIVQRSHLFIDDVILGLDELQRQRKVVLIHCKGEIHRQMAFRIL